jgi:hypothetical protein
MLCGTSSPGRRFEKPSTTPTGSWLGSWRVVRRSSCVARVTPSFRAAPRSIRARSSRVALNPARRARCYPRLPIAPRHGQKASSKKANSNFTSAWRDLLAALLTAQASTGIILSQVALARSPLVGVPSSAPIVSRAHHSVVVSRPSDPTLHVFDVLPTDPASPTTLIWMSVGQTVPATARYKQLKRRALPVTGWVPSPLSVERLVDEGLRFQAEYYGDVDPLINLYTNNCAHFARYVPSRDGLLVHRPYAYLTCTTNHCRALYAHLVGLESFDMVESID